MNWPVYRKPNDPTPEPVAKTPKRSHGLKGGLTSLRRRGTIETVNLDTATQGEPAMTEQDKAAAATQAKIAAKEAKLKAAADKKAAVEQAKADKKAAVEQAKADKAAAAEQAKAEKAAEKAAEREAKAANGAGNKLGDLAERAKTEYVKGANGQLHNGDEIGAALSIVPAKELVGFMVGLFNEPNKYAHLNYGQQSMNYRNRLRGAISKGSEVNGSPMTLVRLVAERDARCSIVAQK